jgi:opacity protein-like surface antigen
MRKTTVLILLILLQTVPAVLCAQEKYNFEVGPNAGFADWQDRSFQVGPPQALRLTKLGFHLAERPVYGVRVNLLSSGYWGGEVSYAYENNTITFGRPSSAPVALEGAVHHFFYNEVFYPVRYGHFPLLPYFTGGIGVAGYHVSDVTPKNSGVGNLHGMNAKFAFNYGAGVKLNVAHSFGIRADFRHNYSDVPNFGLPGQSSNPAQTVLPLGGKLQMYEGSFGIYYRFKD